MKYELVKYALRHDMRIHSYSVLSNHIHIVLTDTHGELPNFMRDFLREVAKAVGAEIGRWNGFWEPSPYSRVELLDPRRATIAVVYAEANSVLADLVERADEWPGLSSFGEPLGEALRAHRPNTRYYRNSRQAEIVEMQLTAPPGTDPADFRRVVTREVRHVEQRARDARIQNGRKVLGAKAVLRQDPHESPTSWEKRRGRNPTFASTDKWKRVEASQRKQAWSQAYRDALESFIGGVRDVLFPAGTWQMVRHYNCRCEPLSMPA